MRFGFSRPECVVKTRGPAGICWVIDGLQATAVETVSPWCERRSSGRTLLEVCNDRRNVTAPTAHILARVFGNSPDFWLNVLTKNAATAPTS